MFFDNKYSLHSKRDFVSFDEVLTYDEREMRSRYESVFEIMDQGSFAISAAFSASEITHEQFMLYLMWRIRGRKREQLK